MHTLRLHLWTPAFIGGPVARIVDPFGPIRPPSVRGVLRWWFRAAASAVLFPGDDSPAARERMLGDLREAEREIFGDTTQRSRLVVLPATGGAIVRVQPEAERWRGLRYLGYGLFEQSSAEAVVTLRESLPSPPSLNPPTLIELRLGLRRLGPRDQITDTHHRLLAATVWLWLHFGGIGARTRRGWGSLGLAENDQDSNGLFAAIRPVHAAGIPDLIAGLPAGLDQVTALFRENLPDVVRHTSLGVRPHPAIRSIEGIETVTVLPGDHASPVEALELAGRLFLGFRSTLDRRRFGMAPLPDYHSVKTSLQTNVAARRVDRAAFGLPLPFYFRSLGGAKTRFVIREKPAHAQKRDKPELFDRLASPLLFRVHRIGPSTRPRYVTTLVNLADRMDPMCDGEVYQVAPKGGVSTPPDRTILQEFITWAIKEANRARGGK